MWLFLFISVVVVVVAVVVFVLIATVVVVVVRVAIAVVRSPRSLWLLCQLWSSLLLRLLDFLNSQSYITHT